MVNNNFRASSDLVVSQQNIEYAKENDNSKIVQNSYFNDSHGDEYQLFAVFKRQGDVSLEKTLQDFALLENTGQAKNQNQYYFTNQTEID